MSPEQPATEAPSESSGAPSAAGAEPLIPPAPKPAPKFDRSIIEGPLAPAVWKIAWPTMLGNMIGGLQGIVDHVMVGHYVGFQGNAAIGVSWQIFLVVIVFIASIFSGMSVLVARYAGAANDGMVNRTVYQAFVTAMGISLLVLAPIGYFAAPALLDLVNASPEVQREALPYLRIMFVFSWGMMLFFMLGGALRSAGDAQTPLRLGFVITALNVVLNVLFIRGLGPIPAMGTAGAAVGTVIAAGIAGLWSLWRLTHGGWVVQFPKGDYRPDWKIIRALFRFGLPTGVQGIAMNIGGVLMLRFVGSLAMSAEAQAAYAVGYTQAFSFITWTAVGLMGAAAAVAGQNLGAKQPERAEEAVHTAARIGLAMAATFGLFLLFMPRLILGAFGIEEPAVLDIGSQLLRVLSLSGLFIAVALTYTGGLQGTGDTKSPLYISIVSQVIVPLGICFFIERTGTLDPLDIWLAILAGHMTRCALSIIRFRQGQWRHIVVEIDGARA